MRKFAARTPEAIVKEGPAGRPSRYDARKREFRIAPDADVAEILHEYFHHIDHSLTRLPFQTVSTDRGTILGEAISNEIERFGTLGETGRKSLAARIRGDLNLEDMPGAISLNEVGRGHAREYWAFHTGSRYREVFANLGSMFSTGRRGRVKSVLPELAAAFEAWLDAAIAKE